MLVISSACLFLHQTLEWDQNLLNFMLTGQKLETKKQKEHIKSCCSLLYMWFNLPTPMLHDMNIFLFSKYPTQMLTQPLAVVTAAISSRNLKTFTLPTTVLTSDLIMKTICDGVIHSTHQQHQCRYHVIYLNVGSWTVTNYPSFISQNYFDICHPTFIIVF